MIDKDTLWKVALGMSAAALLTAYPAAASASDGDANATSADTIIYDAQIFRSTQTNPWASAVAIRDGKILAIGTYAEVRPFQRADTQLIDAHDRLIIPGIIDAHVHLEASIRDQNTYNCNASPAFDFPQLISAIRGCAAALKPGEWVVVPAYSSGLLPTLSREGALRELDKISPVNPVIVRSDSTHDRWVNSLALTLGNVTRQTVVSNGIIGKDPVTGNLNGLMVERGATNLVDAVSPIGRMEQVDQAPFLERGAEILNSFGVTGWVDARSSLRNAKAYRRIDSEGHLHGRVGISLYIDPDTDKISDLRAMYETASANDTANISTRFAKLFLDGTPVTKTAFVLKPYLADEVHGSDYHGVPKWTPKQLNAMVTALDALNVSVKMHTTGDASVREGLEAVAAARKANGPNGPMHTLAHAGHVAPEDVRLFRKLNVAFDASPTMWFPGPIMDAMISALGKKRAENFWNFRTYLKQGAFVVGGTDWKTLPGEYSDLWSGIEGMITRRNPTGRYPGSLHPREALDVATAIKLYTINSAKALRVDKVTGSLEKGKSADLAILDQNIFKINPDCISDTRPILTMFRGKTVFENKTGSAPKCVR